MTSENDSTTTMRAAVLTEFGDPGVLHIGRVPRPVPIPTEVLVRVHAAGVNPVDWKTRRGLSGIDELTRPPVVVGWDVAGVVEEVGFGATKFTVGDEVYGMPWFPRPAGGYSEYVAAPSRHFAAKPVSLSFDEAAAVPLAALTAWQILVDTIGVQPGQRVLVHAAAGGVGHFAVQFAKHLGAHVTGTASERNHEWLTKLGADEVVDYTRVRFEDVVSDVDAVIDLAGDEFDATSTRSLRTLRPGGLLVAVPSGVSDELAAAAAAAGMRVTPFLVEPDGAALERIGALIDAGVVQVVVEQVLPLDDAAQAHAAVESGRTRGKVVLSVR